MPDKPISLSRPQLNQALAQLSKPNDRVPQGAVSSLAAFLYRIHDMVNYLAEFGGGGARPGSNRLEDGGGRKANLPDPSAFPPNELYVPGIRGLTPDEAVSSLHPFTHAAVLDNRNEFEDGLGRLRGTYVLQKRASASGWREEPGLALELVAEE